VINFVVKQNHYLEQKIFLIMSEDIPEFSVDEIQTMIDTNFGDVARLTSIRDELLSTSHLEEEDVNFLKSTTIRWYKTREN